MKSYASSLLFIMAVLISMSGCSTATNQTHRFVSDKNTLDSILILPDQSSDTMPIVIFVHGDGAMDKYSNSYFEPLFNVFAQHNIASFSWDKAGVGLSSGNWLHQSMQSRANEVVHGIEYLKQHGYQNNPIIILGFSQAGWVIPYLHHQDFQSAILVGGAINWRQQGKYLTQQRLLKNGLINTATNIEQINQFEALTYQAIKTSFSEYQNNPIHQHKFAGEPINNHDHFKFVQRNMDQDSSELFREFDKPLLALFGDSDVNVDIYHSQTHLQSIFSQNPSAKLSQKTYKNATHGLLISDVFAGISPLQWYLKFQFYDEQAFSGEVINDLIKWIKYPEQHVSLSDSKEVL